MSGYCSSTAKTFSAKSNFVSSPTITWMPSGSARVCTTAMVCGWQCSLTKIAFASACLLSAWAMCIALRGGGRFVEQRGVGDIERREVDDHLLEIDERLHAPLRNLRLIRRVGRVPARILKDIPLDHRRDNRAAVPLPEVVFADAILLRERPQFRQRFILPCPGRQTQRATRANLRRHRRIDQRLHRRLPQCRQQRFDFRFARAEVPAREGIAGSEWRAVTRCGGRRSRKRIVHRVRLGIAAFEARGIPVISGSYPRKTSADGGSAKSQEQSVPSQTADALRPAIRIPTSALFPPNMDTGGKGVVLI